MASTILIKDVVIHWREYLELCKPKVVALLVFTAVIGMFLATPGMVPFSALFWGTLGIGLASGSAAAINHVIDRRADAEMGRTHKRPLPQGIISTRDAFVFAISIGVIAMAILVFYVNVMTAVLTFISLIGYAVVYTMYLKRATPQNIVIGGAAGAAPPLLGWTAVTGYPDPGALLLFLIIFIWTPPHFWALAIHRREEYAKVNIPMLPVTHGVPFTELQILLYTVLLILVTMLPYLYGMSGLFYLVTSTALGMGFLYHAIRLYWGDDKTRPMRTFGYSIVYLMALFSVLLIDHYIPAVTYWLS